MNQTPITLEERQATVSRQKQNLLDRGKLIKTIEAKYWGSEEVEETKGAVMVNKVMENLRMKQKKRDTTEQVTVSVTNKGIYIDSQPDKKKHMYKPSLIKKVDIRELTYVALGKNKKIFAFVYYQHRLHRSECHVFEGKNGGTFPKVCNEAVADHMAESHRAESEAALICSATPIMPIAEELPTPDGELEERWVDEDGTRVRDMVDYDPIGSDRESDFDIMEPLPPAALPERPSFWYDSVTEAGWVPPDKYADAVGRFKAHYLGSVPVRDYAGPNVVREAAQRLSKLPQNPADVTCIITNQAITLVDRLSGDFVQHDPLPNVTYTLLDPHDGRHFSYITHTSGQGFAYCHILRFYTHGDKVVPAMAAAMRECVITELAQPVDQALEVMQDTVMADHGERVTKRNFGLSKHRSAGDSRALGIFDVKFLGSVPVAEDHGNEVCLDALDELFYEKISASETAEEFTDWTDINSQNAVVTVTPDSVRVEEFLTCDLLDDHFLQHICFTTFLDSSPDEGARHDIFCIITQDECLGRLACHAFQTPPGKARDMCKAIANARKHPSSTAAASMNSNPLQIIKPTKNTRIINLFKDQIDRGDLELHEAIGAGQFGPVFRASQTMVTTNATGAGTQKIVRAVKLLMAEATEKEQANFVRELLSLQNLTHDNIVSMAAVNVLHFPWLVVLELAQYGELRKALLTADDKGLKLSTTEQYHIALQLATGMDYLASKNRVHMGLTAKNVLLDHDCHVRICGLSACRELEEGKTQLQLHSDAHVRLPLRWRAIENFENKIYSQLSDVWSFGVTVWEVVNYGTNPFRDIKTNELRRRIVDGERLQKMPAYPCPEELMHVLHSCWERDPTKRLKFHKLVDAFEHLLATSRQNTPEIRDIGALLLSMDRCVRNTDAKPEWLQKRLRKTKALDQLLAKDTAAAAVASQEVDDSKNSSGPSGNRVGSPATSGDVLELADGDQLKDKVLSPWRLHQIENQINPSRGPKQKKYDEAGHEVLLVPQWKQLIQKRREARGLSSNSEVTQNSLGKAPSKALEADNFSDEPGWLRQLKTKKSMAILKPASQPQRAALTHGMSMATSLVAKNIPADVEKEIVESLRRDANDLAVYADRAVIDRATAGQTVSNPLFFDEDDEDIASATDADANYMKVGADADQIDDEPDTQHRQRCDSVV